MSAAPPTRWAKAARASLVTPQGQVLTRPIARWNRLTRGAADLPVAPGASLVSNPYPRYRYRAAMGQRGAAAMAGRAACPVRTVTAGSWTPPLPLSAADDDPTAPGTSGNVPVVSAR